MGKTDERINISDNPIYSKINKEYHTCHDEVTKLYENLEKLNQRINDVKSLYDISYGEYIDMEFQVKLVERQIQSLKIQKDIWNRARDICINELYKERSE